MEGATSDEYKPGIISEENTGTLDYLSINNFSNRYLATYYKAIDPDEHAVLNFLVDEFKKIGNRKNMLEIGCGPTIHHLISAANYVEEIYAADYLSDNINEVKKWIENDQNSHNWEEFIKAVLLYENSTIVDKENIHSRANLIRSKIKDIIFCDLRKEQPIKLNTKFDIVTSFYCAEEVALEKNEWRKVIKRIGSLVKNNGYFLMSALKETKYYKIVRSENDQEKEVIPTAFISERDFTDYLPQLGFTDINLKTVQTSEQAENGVSAIILVSARKK